MNSTEVLEDDREVLKVRLSMARAFANMMQVAYDALLHHGVNFRVLKEYNDETLIEQAATLKIKRQEELYNLWMERVGNGIRAAIRRKSLKPV